MMLGELFCRDKYDKVLIYILYSSIIVIIERRVVDMAKKNKKKKSNNQVEIAKWAAIRA